LYQTHAWVIADRLSQELLMATKRSGRTKRRPWTKQDVRELKEHSRNKSPVKKIARAMRRTISALRQKALSLGLSLVPLHSDFDGLNPGSK
jgi:hypothetical protein